MHSLNFNNENAEPGRLVFLSRHGLWSGLALENPSNNWVEMFHSRLRFKTGKQDSEIWKFRIFLMDDLLSNGRVFLYKNFFLNGNVVSPFDPTQHLHCHQLPGVNKDLIINLVSSSGWYYSTSQECSRLLHEHAKCNGRWKKKKGNGQRQVIWREKRYSTFRKND